MSSEQPFDLEAQLDRYAAGELSDAELQDLIDRVNADPELRSALDEYYLSLYVDGELNRIQVADLRERLQAEPELQEALDEYEAIERELAALGEQPIDVDYAHQRESILDEVHRRTGPRRLEPPRKPFRAITIALAVIAAALLLLNLYLLLVKMPKSAPTPTTQNTAETENGK